MMNLTGITRTLVITNMFVLVILVVLMRPSEIMKWYVLISVVLFVAEYAYAVYFAKSGRK